MSQPPITVCPACGGREFAFIQVIWPELAAEWRLAPDELAYVDRQQGGHCVACGVNFRAMALASAISQWLEDSRPLSVAIADYRRPVRILEINEAGRLTPILRKAASWTFAAYPEVDMHALPYADGAFDLVVHSDTLEHIAEPVHALAECRRVLAPAGACCYTVPMIVGRLTSGRAGLPPSYHGGAYEKQPDYLVHTEFGADAWLYPVRAGFERVSIVAFDFPAAVAFACEVPSRPV